MPIIMQIIRRYYNLYFMSSMRFRMHNKLHIKPGLNIHSNFLAHPFRDNGPMRCHVFICDIFMFDKCMHIKIYTDT